ncbi:MAG: glucose-1-phosphate cytidylyltransferase [Myxococcota bacterium]
MKVVILAGGFGTRFAEETDIKPKPMIEIGGRPILWHILKIYSHYGFNEFIICLGYKGYIIKEFFMNYYIHQSDITVDLKENRVEIHKTSSEQWRVTLIDTGLNTMTGGRLKRVRDYIDEDEFMMTYGDGVGDININELLKFHRNEKTLATLTAVQPSGRFGVLKLDGNRIISFQEKPKGDGGWINAGFFVLNKKVFDYITGDETIWEREPLERLARDGQLIAYKHYGFWKPMDTLRDKRELEELWQIGRAPWKVW